MAQPQAYNRDTDFTERDGDDTNHAALNTEFDAAAQSINQLRTNLAQIQRDDGALKNQIVTADALAPSAFNAVLVEVNEAVQDAQASASSALTSATTANTARDQAVAARIASETARDSSITNSNAASASAQAAATSQTAAAASQADALASKNAAAASQTAAANSATSASNSAATATTQAGIATTQAGNSAGSATASASSAAGSQASRVAAEAARDDAQTARTQAQNAQAAAASSASAAAASQSAASTSASSAGTSATAAATSATQSANSATASANSASASQTSRLASESARDAAAASQTAAASSASAAATSATASANSATASANSATASASSATSAASSLTSFRAVYLGASATAPTVDGNGNALAAGDLYFDTTLQQMRVFSGSAWTAAGSTVNGTARRQVFTATAGQTSFTITGGYDSGFADVYLNGVKLTNGDEVIVTSGTTVVLAQGAAAGDIVDVVAYGAFAVANTWTQAEANARYVAKTGDTMTGSLTVNGGRLIVGQAAGDVAAIGKDAGGNAFIDANIAGADFGVYTQASGGGGSQRRLRVDGSGRVTMPYQPSFSARWASRTFIFGSGNTVWDQAVHNIGGHYNTSTGRFTAPVSGVYQFSLNSQHYGGTATGGTHDILINGSFRECRCEHVTGGNFECHTVVMEVYMNAGDYAICQSSSAIWWSDHSQFCGHLIG